MKRLKLANGTPVFLDDKIKYGKCSGCGAKVVWALTINNKPMPIIKSKKYTGWISHFVDCPEAPKFRKKA